MKTEKSRYPAITKRIISIIFTIALLTGTVVAATYAAADADYPVLVNGVPMTFTDVLPVNINGRTLLPLRATAEALDISIEWVNNRVEITTIDTEALKNACVMLYTGKSGQYDSQGSGVLIDYDEILTCFHVIDGDTMLTAYYDDSAAAVSCTIADTAANEDAAILTPSDKNVKPVTVGDSDTVEVGDTVYIISSPNQSKNVVTSGVVTGTGDFKGVNVIITTASTDGGSSGGACFNSKGELLGMVIGGSDETRNSYIAPINDIRRALAN